MPRDKSYDTNNEFCEELGYVSDQIPEYHAKILLRYFTAIGGRHAGERILARLRCW
jgi:hypothetical protein